MACFENLRAVLMRATYTGTKKILDIRLLGIKAMKALSIIMLSHKGVSRTDVIISVGTTIKNSRVQDSLSL
jgi:hypothetical protein